MIKDEAYYLSLDKRTKEFKQWKQNYQASKGVGDVVADITKMSGIDYMVKKLFGEDCGCKERQEALNKYYGRPINPLTEEDYIFLDSVINGGQRINPKQQLRMREIYERVFNVSLKGACLSCSFVKTIYNPMEKLFNKYK
jgi:hypothetical protein